MCPACLLLPSQGCRHGAGGTEPIYLKFTLAPRDLHLTFWMSLGQVLREGTTGQLVTLERASFSHQVQMHCAFFGKGQATAALACPIQVQVYSSGPQGGLLPNMHPEPMVHCLPLRSHDIHGQQTGTLWVQSETIISPASSNKFKKNWVSGQRHSWSPAQQPSGA